MHPFSVADLTKFITEDYEVVDKYLPDVAFPWRERLERLPLVAVFATVALILAQPLGLTIQRDITTSGDMGALEIVSIEETKPVMEMNSDVERGVFVRYLR